MVERIEDQLTLKKEVKAEEGPLTSFRPVLDIFQWLFQTKDNYTGVKARFSRSEWFLDVFKREGYPVERLFENGGDQRGC